MTYWSDSVQVTMQLSLLGTHADIHSRSPHDQNDLYWTSLNFEATWGNLILRGNLMVIIMNMHVTSHIQASIQNIFVQQGPNHWTLQTESWFGCLSSTQAPQTSLHQTYLLLSQDCGRAYITHPTRDRMFISRHYINATSEQETAAKQHRLCTTGGCVNKYMSTALDPMNRSDVRFAKTWILGAGSFEDSVKLIRRTFEMCVCVCMCVMAWNNQQRSSNV